MSSFDEAFNKASAENRHQDDAQGRTTDRRRRAAEAAVPIINQLLRDFVQRMVQHGVQPRQVKIYYESKRGLLGIKSKPVYSPAGYVLYETHYTKNPPGYLASLALLTPEGKVFRFSHAHNSADHEAGFVPITADNLMRGKIRLALGHPIEVDDDGELHISFWEGDHDRRYSVAESLGKRAAQLVREDPLHRAEPT